VKQLRARTAVVTGAASGIGLALVEAFVAEGMRVVMSDVDEPRLAAEARRLADAGAPVHAVAVDVRDPEAVDALGRAAVDRSIDGGGERRGRDRPGTRLRVHGRPPHGRGRGAAARDPRGARRRVRLTLRYGMSTVAACSTIPIASRGRT
jgi:NAD(P)-dependent dehydrogenase (short-subunit alcohol dehydrogenase family)